MPERNDEPDFNAALREAIHQAKAERVLPLRREKFRTELMRLIKIYACLYAREHGLTQNIEVLRDLERLEATVFINRTSVAVEDVRNRAMEHRQEIWAQIEVVMDLLKKDEVGERP